ncbi:PadR family transcriptional regulator [Streptomyces sulphureus]|uniref:PadR family transcriptional regulator n=1 Tax=Streptomyces sulphureus TaxID=47758 RepID=UPI0003823D03|nr:PadR family transcriptional regulator [Streptomyces sulphureus]
MPPVFAHGRLRLYLLKLLEEAPRHGYEIMRLLKERFQGLYAPSAGTVYPRLAKLEAEGLVTHTTEGGRKTYAITPAGLEELADRKAELAELELEIGASLSALAADIREDVRGSADDLRREMRQRMQGGGRSASATGSACGEERPSGGAERPSADGEAWRRAKEEVRRAKEAWKEQAREAKDEARRAKHQAEKEREAHQDAVEELQRVARRVRDQVQSGRRTGDWATALRDGMAEFTREMDRLGQQHAPAPPPEAQSAPPPQHREEATPRPDPAWGEEVLQDDPARSLERLLDRFRDDIRDAARDTGVDERRLREVRRQLSTTAAHLGAALRDPDVYFGPDGPGTARAEKPAPEPPTGDDPSN